jgi:hypothetical protein
VGLVVTMVRENRAMAGAAGLGTVYVTPPPVGGRNYLSDRLPG